MDILPAHSDTNTHIGYSGRHWDVAPRGGIRSHMHKSLGVIASSLLVAACAAVITFGPEIVSPERVGALLNISPLAVIIIIAVAVFLVGLWGKRHRAKLVRQAWQKRRWS